MTIIHKILNHQFIIERKENMNKIIGFVFIIICFSNCGNPTKSIKSFKSFSELLSYSKEQACNGKKNYLKVFNYDGTEYTPQIKNSCEFNLADYDRRNLCYISLRDRNDGINLASHTQVVKSKMDEFLNNMGGNSSWSESPDKAIFILQLPESISMINVNQNLMALSVVFEEVLHFKYRDQMKGIPVILTSKELYGEN